MPPLLRGGFAKPEQKAVVDVRQAKPRAFAAAIVHEYLETRRAVVADISRNAGELRLGRNDKVIAEIDARAFLGDRDNIVEDRLERLGRHQIGNEGGDAALRRRRRLAVGVKRLARTRNVLAVPEMQMHVDGAGHDHEASRRHLLLRGSGLAGSKNGGDLAVADGDIAGGAPAPGKDGVAASDHEIESIHRLQASRFLSRSREARRARRRSASRRRISTPCRRD